MRSKIVKDTDIIDFVECFFDFYAHPYQKDFLIACCTNRRVAALWSRQTGKSTCIAMFAAYICLTNKDYSFIVIAPTQRQSSELYIKIRKIIQNSKFFLKYIESSTQTELAFKNGSRIVSLPSGDDGTNIKGFTAKTVVLEECGTMKDSVVNEAVTPMIAATEGQIIKIGTPKGKNNFWQSCYGKETNYKLFHVPYQTGLSSGQYKQKFIDEQRRNLTNMQFTTEYEAKFIEDSDRYFKQKLIEACQKDYEMWFDGSQSYSIQHKFFKYYLGVDIARLGEDVTVLTILEAKGGGMRITHLEEIKHKKLTAVVGRIKQLNNLFNFEKICLDETGIGAGPTDMLSEELGHIVEGVTFTVKSKENMYSNLKKLMEQSKLTIPIDRKLFYEMSDLMYEITGSGNTKIHHPEGGHDDYPDSLALACWAAKEEEIEYCPAIG